MRNIRDWCISRQIWWGHRIPAWHCGKCKEIIVARTAPAACPKCGAAKPVQDPDTLETWFSSALWPFATMGWPDETPDYKTYYPTTLLITGYDILFFWVARMIMMALRFTGQVPFRRVSLHSLVRTAEGAKMSKSKGTGLDPIELNRKYGTDAVRFTLASMAAPGTDIILTDDRLLANRAFANKIWNAARFLFLNLDKFSTATGATLEEVASPEKREWAPYAASDAISLADRWIFSRIASVTEQMNQALEGLRFHEAAHVVYHYFWGDFCDWYIEWVKPELSSTDRSSTTIAYQNLFAAFELSLRLLHPFMPFLTEELWQRLPQPPDARSIALAAFPVAHEKWKDAQADADFALIEEIITSARNLRAEMKVDPKRKVAADFFSPDAAVRALAEAHRDSISRLATLSELRIGAAKLEATGGGLRSTTQFDLRIAYGEAVDAKAELTRLAKERERLTRDIESKRARLADTAFRERAPAKIVADLEHTLGERVVELDKLIERVKEMEKLAGDSAPG
jgi:valyl-tRNA synthetase